VVLNPLFAVFWFFVGDVFGAYVRFCCWRVCVCVCVCVFREAVSRIMISITVDPLYHG